MADAGPSSGSTDSPPGIERGAGPTAASSAGPLWMWATAWSVQGACVLAVDTAGPEDTTLRLLVLGAAAALPLAGLRVALAARGRADSSRDDRSRDRRS